MLLAIKIILTIFLVVPMLVLLWIIIDEIKEYRNWPRLIASLLLIVAAALHILILWCV